MCDNEHLELLSIVMRSDIVKALRSRVENEKVRERLLSLNRRSDQRRSE